MISGVAIQNRVGVSKSEQPSGFVLIVEDHPLVADSLAACVRDCNPALAVEVAESLGAALRILFRRAGPELITTDLTLPDSQGIESIRRLRDAAPASPLLVFTALDDSQLRHAASELGAMDYLLKSSSAHTLRNRVRNVLGKGAANPEAISPVAPVNPRVDPGRLSNLFTAKQQRVLEELMAGRSNREIAARMNISPETVASHMKEVFSRLAVRNRTEAVVRYLDMVSQHNDRTRR